MNVCVVIPVFNHADTLPAVARAAQKHFPVIVADDGSTDHPRPPEDIAVVRLEQNRGKGAALRAGFQLAVELGFTHAITMDADGQHSAEDLPKFTAACVRQPEALIVGVRNLKKSGAPGHRQCSNAVSNFWFRVETGVRLADTQCGFRCYPLALTQWLKARSQHYAFELEFMVRAAWLDTPIVPVPVTCSYLPKQIRHSHFRPVVDLARITIMNIGLVLQSWFVPQALRTAWSLGQKKTPRRTIGDFFSEHAHDPLRMSLAVGLGLFCGIAPIWGYQMIVAAALAHFLRLNKAITLMASNISIPPLAPFIVGVAFILGHWIFTGEVLALSWPHMTRASVFNFFWQFLIGSIALATIVATFGTITAYAVARLVKRK
ncbi:MAG: DUF2062 domain-containing protein [Verrucomicrobiota bacterium]|jgi:hypothetical protein